MGIVEVITVFAIVATNLGTVIALYINSDKNLIENRKETNDILKSIQTEMKDFHGKLERQDAEFKAHMLYIHKGTKE
jgi:hypothetical protein